MTEKNLLCKAEKMFGFWQRTAFAAKTFWKGRVTVGNLLAQILESVRQSPKRVEVLPVEDAVAQQIAEAYEINRENLLGTVLFQTGGILIDRWIRVYGAGKANFYRRNRDFPFDDILVAEDVVGGLFALLAGGKVGYFAPDALVWEDTELTYGQFLYWCLQGDTDTYYMDFRWKGWAREVEELPMEKGVAFYPFLWAKADFLESRHRETLPMEEIIRLELEMWVLNWKS